MTIEEAIDLIRDGKCILFTGSGFSFGAKNSNIGTDGKGEPFLSAKDLCQKLVDEFGLEEPEAGLGVVAGFYLEKYPKSGLIDFLKKEFTASEISDSHKTIGRLPWRRCYTTNYDEILEKAMELAGSPRKMVTLSTPVKDVPNSMRACVHINGVISRLTPDTLEGEFKLTTRSYNADDLHYSPWFERFKNDLLNADAVFFIGFSGAYDLDLTRLFQQTRELREKSFFIVAPDERRSVVKNLSDFGSVEKIGLDGFVSKLESNPDVFKKPRVGRNELILKCFKNSVNYNSLPPQNATKDVVRLLSRGVINDHLLHFAVREPEHFKYTIYREKLNLISSKIKEGLKTFLITSSLGNGKTVFMKELAVRLKRMGYEPFFFVKEREFVSDEVEQICSSYKAPVLFFDGYVDSKRIIKDVQSRMSNDTVLVMSERTARYETSYEWFEIFEESPFLVSIDRLEPKEVESLTELLDTFGLWDSMASKSREEKIKYITRNCKSSLSSFLLSHLDAKQLRDSYSHVMDSIRQKEDFYQAILFILWCTYLGINLEFGSIMESMVGNVMNNPMFIKNPAIKEMIDFDEERIYSTSSILAIHILTRQITPGEFVDFYIKLIKSLDRKSSDRNVKKILKEMMQHRNISRIVRDNSVVISIYDNISDLRFCVENPQFWLQNAITRMAGGDYETANHHFETAYSLAKDIPGYSTYQIDTHHARYLLESAVKCGLPMDVNAFDIFIDAHTKLKTRRKGDDYRYYIYRVAYKYLPFWDKFKTTFTAEQIVSYKKACREILDMAQEYMKIPDATNKDIVEKTLNALNEILA